MNALEPGSSLGGYRILARLRAGAMGVLYLARRDILLSSGEGAAFARPVAIKVIHEHLASNKRFVRMFIDEAKLCARIDDPNVVRVEEFGQVGGRYYLVMEYVHGASLAQAIGVLRPRGGIPMTHAVQIAMQIAGGLHGAHEATADDGAPLGIVHRDVSPHNVLLSYKGYVRVIDFGIARAKQVGGQTKTGSLRGKLAYMPPEQARSARTVDRRADLYAVGLCLWEMLTGRRVFDADSDIAILNQIREARIDPPSSIVPNLPRRLDQLVMRLLEQDPDKRPPTGAHLQRELADALPEALRVMPVDLASLMTRVKSAAADVSRQSVRDEASEYGHEVVQTLALFGESLQDSVDAAGDTNPSAPDLEEKEAPASDDVTAAFVKEDEATTRDRLEDQKRTMRVPTHLLPRDGVRPIPVPPGSSPDMLIPPMSSARVMPPAPTSSAHDLGGGMRISHEPMAMAPIVPTDAIVITSKQKLALVIGVPIACAFVIAFAILVSSSNQVPPAAAAPRPRPPPSAEPPPKPPPVPIVIMPTDPSIDAGEIDVPRPAPPTRGASGGGRTRASAASAAADPGGIPASVPRNR